MSASSKISPRHVLRGILRGIKVNKAELPKEQQKEYPGATISYVLQRYRADQAEPIETNADKNKELHKLAYEYMILRKDIHERTRLQRLDTGAEKQLSPLEMSRRAAARAGLQLPDVDVPDFNK